MRTLAAGLACLLSTSLAPGYVVATDGKGRPLAWRGISVRLVVAPAPDALAAELLAATERAARHWREATGLDIVVRADAEAPRRVSEDGRSSILMRTQRWCPDDPSLPCHDPSRHALTQLYTRPLAGDRRTAEVLEADIEVNAVHFDWHALPPRSLDAVLLHELGHVLGLDHSCGASSLLQRVDHRGAPVPTCEQAPRAVRAATMYPDPLEPITGGREELSDDELLAGADLYAGSSGIASLGRPAWFAVFGLGCMGALWLARSAHRARRPRHGRA